MLNIIVVAVTFAVGLLSLRLLFLHLRDFQQMGYKTAWYFRWLIRHRTSYSLFALVLLVCILAVALLREQSLAILLTFVTITLIALSSPVFSRSHQAKKPLVFTSRALRLLFASIACITLAIGAAVSLAILRSESITVLTTIAMLATLASLGGGPLFLLIGNAIMFPLEETSRRRYVSLAHDKSLQLKPKRVGITGSYGKTSVKELVAATLAAKYSTLKTPQSFNTPMGISKVIREDLQPHHDAFVIEMGAYQTGEIRSLCELVGPLDAAVVTGINEQHFERFGSLQATMRAKFEVVQGLNPEGLAVFNGDNHLTRQMADSWHGQKVIYGLDSAPCDLSADDLRYGHTGSKFSLVMVDGSRHQLRIQLIGKHNILNALAAVAVGIHFDIRIEEIAAALASVPPVPHRLQPSQLPGGATLIDDTYSSNPDGASAALDVLKSWPAKRRMIVTPGFIELGAARDSVCQTFAKQIAAICDFAVLVGEAQSKPIREGLRAQGFPADRLITVDSVRSAIGEINTRLGSGDVVLMENDLPDVYESPPTLLHLFSRVLKPTLQPRLSDQGEME